MANANIKRVRSSEIELKDKLVGVNRVTKVTKGGRTFSFSALVVVGDGNGIVGYGLGKAMEVTDAISKGIDDAKKNLVKVPVLKGTVPHEQFGKYSGGRVFLKPAAHGTGVIAGGAIRIVLEVAGVKNVIAKQLGSNNLLNNARASICALENLTTKSEVTKKRNLTLN
jgi:small subunit ribosomal protein S5